MFKSIRILLAIVAFHDYEIWQMDVKTAFLNGNLRRGCVHDTAYGFWRSRDCWEGMQASWIHLWIEACITELESSIWQISQNLDFVRCEEESYVYRKTSGSAIAFLNLICRWHTLNRKRYSSILQLAKSSLKKSFLDEGLGRGCLYTRHKNLSR